MWLPQENWNGRYYQLGNGGFAGNISHRALAAEVRAGNAAAMTDTGHRGSGTDASWAGGHPQRVVDYGHRSLSATAETAHAVMRAYYGKTPRYRYFAGCSNGGRQALMAAQRYPEWWDGIVAGAPASHWTQQLAVLGSIQHALRANPQSWIPPRKLPAIQRAALASCTPEAIVIDRTPTDPRFCRLDVQALVCRGKETDECLTSEQAAALNLIQHGLEGAPFGFEPTAAAVPDNWNASILNSDAAASSQRVFAEQFFRHLVLSDADWTVERLDPARALDLARDVRVAGEPLSSVLDATRTDLSAFERSGGKVLMYFGWADALLSPRMGLHYYEDVARQMGGFDNVQRFFRLFMVPGMKHCQGGRAPSSFGQAPVAPARRNDAQHDIRRALEAWVERGDAPDALIAAKYIDNEMKRGVAATQLLCPFPQRPVPRGKTSSNSASGYECADGNEE